MFVFEKTPITVFFSVLVKPTGAVHHDAFLAQNTAMLMPAM